MVPPDSHGISGVPYYLGSHPEVNSLRLQEFHPLRCSFPATSTSLLIYHFSTGQQPSQGGPTTPTSQRLSAITQRRFGLFRFRSPLLTESLLFSLPVGTEMFHFPTFPPTALYIQAEVAGHDSGTSRFPYSDIPGSGARLPAPLGLSQVTTSFFGSWCQGIHRSHLVACHTKKMYLQRCSRPL